MHKLEVNWTISQTPKPKSWLYWDDFIPQSANEDVNGLLNSATISFIEKAKSLGLTKDIGWSCRSDYRWINELVLASKIYQRGVKTNFSEAHREDQNGKYNIYFYENSLSFSIDNDSFYVIDKNFYNFWSTQLNLDNINNRIICETRESDKNLSTMNSLIVDWKKSKAKNWIILGGGVLADTAAFAASLVDCSFSLIPTTLLAMVDGCVGGKCGVNFSNLKNYIGVFNFPGRVDIFQDFLTTLNKDEFFSGTAECFKHLLLASNHKKSLPILDSLRNLRLSSEELIYLVSIKAEIITLDSNDQNQRNYLNFGHNFAHALEALEPEHWKHGEAVWVGLLFDLHLSKNLNFLPLPVYNSIIHILSSDLPMLKDCISKFHNSYNRTKDYFSRLCQLMQYDKKNTARSLNWVLLKDWAKPCFPISIEFNNLLNCEQGFIHSLQFFLK